MSNRIDFESRRAFHRDNPLRMRSESISIGTSLWRDRSHPRRRYKVFYLKATGEVIAEDTSGSGWLHILGIIPPDPQRAIWHGTMTRILAGWTSHMFKPDGLDWIREQIRTFHAIRDLSEKGSGQ